MRGFLLAGMMGLASAGCGSNACYASPNYYDFSLIANSPDLGAGSFSGEFGVESGLITSMTGAGTRIGAVTGLLAPGTFPVSGDANDNKFYSTAPYLNTGGVSFTTTSLGSLNLYYAGFGNYSAYGSSSSEFGSLIVTPAAMVPEPACLALLGLSVGGIAALRRRWMG